MHHGCIIIAEGAAPLMELCGISILERLLRNLQRCGLTEAIILSSTPSIIKEHLAPPSWPRAELKVTIQDRPEGVLTVDQICDIWPDGLHSLLLISGATVFDIRLLRRLCDVGSPTVLLDSVLPAQLQTLVESATSIGSSKLCGAAVLRRDWATAQHGSVKEALQYGLETNALGALDAAREPLYYPNQLRELRPFWFRAPLPAQKKEAEEILLDSIQKGELDIPAMIHAPIEKFLVSYLCKTSVTPHHLTILWAAAAVGTTLLFAAGSLLWGVIVALLVGIVDGLDGKQARLKVETTKQGKVEHHLDSLFAFVWPAALAYHFHTSGELPNAFGYLLLLFLGEALDGAAQAGIRFTARKSMKDPSLFGRMIRLVGGRRNIFVWVLIATILAGAPARSLIIMAYWELTTAALDFSHLAWAYSRMRKESWNQDRKHA